MSARERRALERDDDETDSGSSSSRGTRSPAAVSRSDAGFDTGGSSNGDSSDSSSSSSRSSSSRDRDDDDDNSFSSPSTVRRARSSGSSSSTSSSSTSSDTSSDTQGTRSPAAVSRREAGFETDRDGGAGDQGAPERPTPPSDQPQSQQPSRRAAGSAEGRLEAGPPAVIAGGEPGPESQAVSRLDEQTLTDIRPGDVQLEQEDQTISAQLTQQAQQAEQTARDRARAQRGLVENLRQQQDDDRERFAFSEDTLQRNIVEGLEAAGESVSQSITPERIRQTTASLTAPPGQQEPDFETEPSPAFDFATGAGEILNVPATAAGVAQGIEFAAVAAQRSAQGEADQVSADTQAAAQDISQGIQRSVTDQPVRTAGLAAGSLIASSGAIRAAERTGARSGQAARLAIQPGEEIAGAAGSRATRAVAGERAAQTLFPQGEPVIFSEEAAIRAGRRTVDVLSPPADGSIGRVGSGLGASGGRADVDVRSQEAVRAESETAESEPGVEVDVDALQGLDIEDISAAERQLLEEALGDVNLEGVTEAETETEAQTQSRQPQAETTTAAEAPRRPELNLDDLDSQQSQVASDIDQEFALQQTNLDQGVDIITDVETATDVATDVETAQNVDQVVDVLSETETTQLETEAEIDQDLETSFESVFETELETEGERRRPPLIPEDDLVSGFDSLSGVRTVEATLSPTELDNV